MSVLPRYTKAPCPKESVLDFLNLTLITDGTSCESIAISEKQIAGEWPEQDVNSPDLKKPKKARQHAAQESTDSKSGAVDEQNTLWRDTIIPLVIGRRTRCGLCEFVLLMPLITYWTKGQSVREIEP